PGGQRLISAAAYNNLLNNLLNQRGDAGQWREHPQLCGVTLPIPETENHIWMTESSRFLTNQLLRLRVNPADADSADAGLGSLRWNNKANGMKTRILDRLADVLAHDFHEYNARPYARLTAKALENLYDFSRDREVKLASRIVLDFISAKF